MYWYSDEFPLEVDVVSGGDAPAVSTFVVINGCDSADFIVICGDERFLFLCEDKYGCLRI